MHSLSNSQRQLVLASSSATRGAILRNAGINFTATAPRVDEDTLKTNLRLTSIEDWAIELARGKALSLNNHEDFVLGADQTLIIDNEILHKPNSINTAREQLRTLRGRAHRLKTAAVICKNGNMIWSCTREAKLHMRNFSDSFLEQYLEIQGPEILTTVGGYKIEGRGAQLFINIEGDHFTILGLPLWPLLEFLRQEGLLPT
jgi:septum formation protein